MTRLIIKNSTTECDDRAERKYHNISENKIITWIFDDSDPEMSFLGKSPPIWLPHQRLLRWWLPQLTLDFQRVSIFCYIYLYLDFCSLSYLKSDSNNILTFKFQLCVDYQGKQCISIQNIYKCSETLFLSHALSNSLNWR